ncbi:hypothetical protein IFR05_008437 [Cadophora sp. M221]|nr:hypothetical protein IFR05_008437 [Cadophora sp. M221]
MSASVAHATPPALSSDLMASENAEPLLEFEIPGRSVHPAKLTAMLRANFGIGAYDIMVKWLEMYTPSGYLGVCQRTKLLVVGSRESEDMMTVKVAGVIEMSEDIDTVTEDGKDAQ